LRGGALLSPMTGMAAAPIVVEKGAGILLTMPAPDAAAVDRFRLQTVALGLALGSGARLGRVPANP
jgi:hypothetical protein